MPRPLHSILLGSLFSLGLTASASALPVPDLTKHVETAIESVQLRCDQYRCYDPRTGLYGQSTCDAWGCRPSSGPTGVLSRRQYYQLETQRPSRSGRQFDCNRSRCIELRTGALWESTCNYRGCFPLRPARQRAYGGYSVY